MRVHITHARPTTHGAWRERLRADLSAVADLVRGFDRSVFLVGGLGMAVRTGDFYRDHRDVDLAVFVDDAQAFGEHLRSRGSVLVNQVLGTYMTPWHRMQVTTDLDPETVTARASSLHLRVVPEGTTGVRLASRSEYVDVFLLAPSRRGIELLGYDVAVPMDEFFPCVPLPDMGVLRLPRAQYKEHLPPTNPTQQRDMLRAGLSPRIPSGRESSPWAPSLVERTGFS